MTLAAGTRLGPYEIASRLGAGGMGEVYKAHDTQLRRDVALKILPSELALDPEHLARFDREAQALAALNHPHIAQVYGFVHEGDIRAIVMELVEGPTLAERIARGQVVLDEAVTLGIQLAEALEYAHERGIVHRDLKPGNIKLTPDGNVKVLDFGLAKVFAADATGASAERLGDSPTITSPAALSRVGIILGTAAYMAPEQARGMAVDKRADIWAFGVVLFEMLTGKPCFSGETVTDVLAAVVKTEPAWSALPATTPARVRELLHRCLAKDRRQRLQAIGDARIEIEEAIAKRNEEAITLRTAWGRRGLPWAVSFVAVIAAAVAWWRSGVAPVERPTHLQVQLPEDMHVAVGDGQPALALSPDGRLLVLAATRSGRTQLYVRPIDEDVLRPVPGTEGGYSPFFSPDGAWIGYFDQEVLMKVALENGAPIPLSDATPVTLGATWIVGNAIVMTVGPETGLRLASAGGEKKLPLSALSNLTRPDYANHEENHAWPSVLPDGRHVLIAIRSGARPDDARLAIVALDKEAGPLRPRLLPELSGTAPAYSDGRLLFVHDGRLLVAPFDAVKLEATGKPTELVRRVMVESTGGAQLAIAAGGSTIAYLEGDTAPTERDLLWVDAEGHPGAVLDHGAIYGPRLSPDGSRVAYAKTEGSNTDVWIADLLRGTKTKVTSHVGEDFAPVWIDDHTLAYASEEAQDKGEAGPGLWRRSPETTNAPVHLLSTPTEGEWECPTSAMTDGKVIFNGKKVATGYGVYLLRGLDDSVPLVDTGADEHDGVLSPDGRWLAYVSDAAAGQDGVYVVPFGVRGVAGRPVSAGTEPSWSRDGGTLFYRDGDKMMAVRMQAGAAVDTPHEIFRGRFDPAPWPGAGPRNYDVARDGRFVMLARNPDVRPRTIQVLLHWKARSQGQDRKK